MKKTLLILLLSISINMVYSAEIVNIWSDGEKDLFGASLQRTWLKSYFLSGFNYYNTIETENIHGTLTAVTVDRDIFFKLEKLLKFETTYTKDFITISREENIYRLMDVEKGLDISFSFEKPNNQILYIINKIYKDDPKNMKAVSDHYKNTWVIRIHSGENVFNPNANSLDFNDILISATIIGEEFQWLWGIHDGANYLEQVLN